MYLVSSYRPVGLLQIFERLLLSRIQPLLSNIVPNHQFGFRKEHNTVQQCHRVVAETIGNLHEIGEFLNATIFRRLSTC